MRGHRWLNQRSSARERRLRALGWWLEGSLAARGLRWWLVLGLASLHTVACGSELEGHFARPDGDALADTAVPDTAIDIADTLDSGPDLVDSADTDDTEEDTALPEVAEDTVEDTVVDVADARPDGSVSKNWRSKLYPENWAPGMSDHETGARLQDYSFAGYHNSALPMGDGLGEGGLEGLPRFNVLDYGAIPVSVTTDDAEDSWRAFQATIDAAAAAGGGVVYVPPGLYRIGGFLEITSSRIVLLGDGPDESRLWFTRRIGLNYAAHIHFKGVATVTAETRLQLDAGVFDKVIAVEDASAFRVGDDVVIGQIISDGFLAEHGMTDTWVIYAGSWEAFYRRNVVAVDASSFPHRLTLDVPLRGPMRKGYGASVRQVSGALREVGLESLGLANAIEWGEAWSGTQIYLVRMEHVVDAWVRDVSSYVSPGAPLVGQGAGAHLQSGGIMIDRSKRVTIAGTHLERAQKRGGLGNGMLFEIRQSSEILTRDSTGRYGRRSFIQNAGFGTSGCVWLRVKSSDSAEVPLGPILDDEVPQENGYLHSLATANLVDLSAFDDGIRAENMLSENSGAGHTSTECVFWNIGGLDVVSLQYGLGYIIGTQPRTVILTQTAMSHGVGTEPADWVEGARRGSYLEPRSLFVDQLMRRLGHGPP